LLEEGAPGAIRTHNRRIHDLRHTAASLMLNNGIPLIVVSRILWHAKPSITLDLYGHLYHEMLGKAAKIMDDLVTPIKVELPRNEVFDDKPHQTAPICTRKCKPA
jgi:integrase